MSNSASIYALQEHKSEDDLKFFFVSEGEQDVVKAVQYSFVERLFDKDIYNLGFGDYDIDCDMVNDTISTNNGDAFKVLQTVLSTIPTFFNYYKDCILMVQGSDGRPEFMAKCKLICSKKCKENCRNFNRRINLYRNYVNKHYDQLSIDYKFFGGLKNKHGYIALEDYIVEKKYDSVLIFRRNV